MPWLGNVLVPPPPPALLVPTPPLRLHLHVQIRPPLRRSSPSDATQPHCSAPRRGPTALLDGAPERLGRQVLPWRAGVVTNITPRVSAPLTKVSPAACGELRRCRGFSDPLTKSHPKACSRLDGHVCSDVQRPSPASSWECGSVFFLWAAPSEEKSCPSVSSHGHRHVAWTCEVHRPFGSVVRFFLRARPSGSAILSPGCEVDLPPECEGNMSPGCGVGVEWIYHRMGVGGWSRSITGG